MDVGLIKTRSQIYSYELFTSEAHVLVYIKSFNFNFRHKVAVQ